jgi:enoyl-[acyl-carrier protein] reductase II
MLCYDLAFHAKERRIMTDSSRPPAIASSEEPVTGFEDNRVVRDTGARYPILQAPMSWIARAQLVSAVSAAGATGLLETSGRDLAASMREAELVRERTDRPFGINLAIRYLSGDEEREQATLAWALDGRVRFVTTSAGDPRRYVRRIKDAGVTVYHSVGTLEAALKAADAGVDGLIVEGGESAGIRAPQAVHTFVLLQAVRARIELPIVAAGGIAGGRGMAGAFALGADGVAMGTRFVASQESPVHENYKAAIVGAAPSDTLRVPLGPGVMARVLKTGLSERFAAGDRDPPPSRNPVQDLYVDGRLDVAMGSAGESAGLIGSVEPVGEIIAGAVAEVWGELERLAGLAATRRAKPAP